MPIFILLFSLIALSFSVDAQEEPEQRYGPILLSEILATEEEYNRTGQVSSDYALTLLTFAGRSDLLFSETGLPYDLAPRCHRLPASATGSSPETLFLSAVRSHRVVMVNEDHLRVVSRAFLWRLLDQAVDAGVAAMGFETFIPATAPKEALYTYSGIYSRDPIFAALVRRAMALGIDVFGYEATEAFKAETPKGRGRLREQEQADTIAQKLRTLGPEDKMLILGGWGHIRESVDPSEKRNFPRMAQAFKTVTGIDPFTIDTTACPPSEQATHSAFLRAEWQAEWGTLGTLQRSVDAMIVFANQDRAMPGAFRKALGKPVIVPMSGLAASQSMLIEAYKPVQGPEEQPLDRLYLRPGEQFPLYLPRGSYRLEIYSRDTLEQKTITVE